LTSRCGGLRPSQATSAAQSRRFFISTFQRRHQGALVDELDVVHGSPMPFVEVVRDRAARLPHSQRFAAASVGDEGDETRARSAVRRVNTLAADRHPWGTRAARPARATRGRSAMRARDGARTHCVRSRPPR
jgi:hypothetical protein